jgi:hypothetical protein
MHALIILAALFVAGLIYLAMVWVYERIPPVNYLSKLLFDRNDENIIITTIILLTIVAIMVASQILIATYGTVLESFLFAVFIQPIFNAVINLKVSRAGTSLYF